MTDQSEPPAAPDRRWPRSVFGVGEEPDARFTFANERTFLAWIRTSLALVGAAVALDALKVPADATVRIILVVLLATAGAVLPITALLRWARSERALRLSRPLPSSAALPLLVVVLIAAGILVLLAGILG
ncbi:DUF202 domain-containing protein [Nakamurella sp. YIM 132087]|uniref:DUF202 domain-containing protein n=1 Tax=Nakamurella alba TaxID=2665158 RepID=A0A7K1FIE9_9ACTN|nr:DUF202 domain-containing protein [Nakamurella alba]MTD13043.1 DUF202 domain-containing protein [Nakamurella alba]